MIRNPLLLLSLVAMPLILPRSVPVTPRDASPVVVQDHLTALHEAMQTFQAGQRSLKKLIADPATNERALLDVLKSLEPAAMAALVETPPTPEGLAGKELALFLVGYKRQIAKLLEQVLAMNEATLRGDAKALKAGYDAFSAVKKSGHQEYRDF